jgi:serine protease Do
MSLFRSLAIATFALTIPLQAIPLQAFAQSTPPSFEGLAETLLPTVVNVSTTTKIESPMAQQGMPEMPQLPPGSPFEQFFKEFYDQYKNGQPQQRGGENDDVSALGSGFVIDAANGYIVTNNHVIKDADEIKIILHDDTTIDATLVGSDEKTDIALLKIKPPAKPLIATKWGDSDTAKVGSWVVAIGNPFGLGGTVTAGIVSARQRNINAGPYDDFIQTDASINRGNSGGPMFNTNGEVIGVNTAIFSPTGGSVGIGFAVPSNLAKNVVEQLIKYGKTKRGWLGVKIQEVTPDMAESLKLDRARGALVSDVTPKSPSAAAGIEAGDVILSFDGKTIEHMRQLPRMVAESEVGKKSTLTVWHKGAEKTVTVDLGQLETAEAEAANGKETIRTPDGKIVPKSTDIAALGLSLATLSDEARKTNDIEKSLEGVLVTGVKRGGAAAEKGLEPGDVIAEVDQQDVSTPADIAAKVEEAQKAGRSSVLLFVARKDDRRFVAVRLGKK